MSEIAIDRVSAEWTHDGTSVMAALASVGARLFVKPVIALWARHPDFPWPYGLFDLLAGVLPAVSGIDRTRVRLPNCTAERQRPADYRPGDEEPRAILYLHGGAFLVGGIRSHRRLVSRLVRTTGIPSLAVNYRKLPKHPISTALEDAMDGLRYLIDSGVAPHNIAVVGDSAGAYLAVSLALEARRGQIGQLGAVGCISPILDLDPTTKLAQPDPDRDPLFPPSALITMWELAQAAEQHKDGIDSLRTAALATASDLAAMPPLLIQIGSGEILRPDSDRLVALSSEGGGQARIEIYNGQIHVFSAGADVIPEGRIALDRLSSHIRRSLLDTKHERVA
ncbi:putative carboxylesterase [Gordonia effusa NBRC 100432]|uniref:Putative carboxylesterase n=1 Tax=Gordonia effusa NBRC 100432 TaxID=1077974 RepID=H0QWP8_9ACTN|nr:alpha/beta hydrolase [Gordonia effusa]GAB17249.1 putative carboxylesterase [Gordonia effusa NBRC 100432]